MSPPTAARLLAAHFRARADRVFHPPEGCLPHPYFSPGGHYQREQWDWDSYWLARGLLRVAATLDDSPFHTRVLRHAEGCLRNTFHLQEPDGAVPILATPAKPNLFRGIVADPDLENPAKPVFAQFLLLVADHHPDPASLRDLIAPLFRYHDHLAARYLAPCGLLVWATDVAIGVDNDPATYGRPFRSSANLLLNCLWHEDLKAAATLASRLGFTAQATAAEARRTALADAINRECWDPVDRLYYSVDVQCADHRARLIPPEVPRGMDLSWRTLPLKIKTFTSFLPLWTGLASPERAVLSARGLLTARHLLGPKGLRTLSAAEPMYDPATQSGNPSNWLGPSWTIASYLVWRGLRAHGLDRPAAVVARRTAGLMRSSIRYLDTVAECYHPDTGEPNFNHNFISWNPLVLEMLLPPQGKRTFLSV